MTTIDLNRLSSLFSQTPSGNVSTVSYEEARILKQASRSSPILGDEHLLGLEVARRKAQALGCELLAYPNVSDSPIVPVDALPKAYQVQEKPIPVRVGGEPLYEDITHALRWFTRDSVLGQIAEAENVCASLGKPFSCLTIDDFPCDYYYEGFMENPSVSGGDKKDNDIHALFSNFPVPDDHKVLVTIWAEDTKAIGRYFRKGFTEIHIVYPSDYYVERRVNERLRWFKDLDVDVNVHYRDDVDSDALEAMTSQEFRALYGFHSSSCFFTNYLPQFFHLGDDFVGTMCLYLDQDSITEQSIKAVIPRVKGPYAFRMDYYNHWFAQNYPEMVTQGHGGVYDPILGIRLSFSVHSCYLDRIYSESMFKGSRPSISRSIGDYTKNGTDSTLKVRTNISWADDCMFDGSPHDSQILSDESFNGVSRIAVHSGLATSDVSYFSSLSDVVYLPMVELSPIETDSKGRLPFDRKLYPGFYPHTVYQVYSYVDVDGSAAFRVADISWKRKSFFYRRWRIPQEYRMPYSFTLDWPDCYVVFIGSNSALKDFGVNRLSYYDACLAALEDSEALYAVQEYEFRALAWNDRISKFVQDDEAYSYIGPHSFVSESPNIRQIEFSSSKAVRRSLVLTLGPASVMTIPSSDSVDVLDAEVFQDMIKHSLPGDLYAKVCVEVYPYSYDLQSTLGGIDEFTFHVDDLVSSFSSFNDKKSLTPFDFFGASGDLAKDYQIFCGDGAFKTVAADCLLPCVNGWFIVVDGDSTYKVSSVYVDI